MSTIRCPYCQAGYALKAIWIGKPLRCVRCEKLFRVRADGGVAEMEDDPASSAQTATGLHVRRDPVKIVATAPAIPVAAAPARPVVVPAPAPAARGAVNKHKLTAEQEAARREMSKALAEVTTRAGDAVKAAPASAVPSSGAKKRRSAEILVVGEGQRDHKNLMAWSMGAAAVIGLVVVCVLLSGMRSQTHEVLLAYVADINGPEAHTPLRLKRMQERAWISGSRGLISVGKVDFSPPKRLKTAAAKPVLAALSGQQYLPECEVWVPADKAKAAAAKWVGTRTLAENVTALASAGIVATTRSDIAKRLEEASVDQETSELLLTLLPHDGRSGQDAAQRIAQGQTPDEVEVISFHGRKGVALLPSDRGYSYPEVPTYEGKLLRFQDKDWPAVWRVLDLRYLIASGGASSR